MSLRAEMSNIRAESKDNHFVVNVNQLQAMLGISQDMIEACRLPFCPDAEQLVDAGEDMFGRKAQMTPGTFNAWQNLCAAAAADGITLQLVSAFRSADYQCSVIQKKLDSGRTLQDILSVNAPPGYSEHHTGCALDVHAGDAEPLTEAFEREPAFFWLNKHAAHFNFYLSYPRDNSAGIAYEPWHWCYREE